jgi:hypothetical protein
MSLNALIHQLKGSSSSGNYGHAGREGKRGGSAGNALSSITSELYHVTKYSSAKNILDHDYFRVGEGSSGGKGLSTTEDPSYFWGSKEVRFVLDPVKLANDYKGKKVAEKIYEGDKLLEESEIRVMSDSAITDAHNYISRIQYNSNDADTDFLDSLIKYSSKYNIPLDSNL